MKIKAAGRALLALLILIAISGNIASCSPAAKPDSKKQQNPEGRQEAIRLRFMSSWGGVDPKADVLQQVLDKFMEDNPGVEVINESMFGDDFLPKLKTDFASGNDPDVFGLWPGSDIRALVKAGKIADITGLMESDSEWKNSFKDRGWSYTTYDNRIYGLPLEIIFESMFINKDLFDRYAIKVPRTYEELKQAVIGFRARGVIPIAYNSLSEGTYLYQNIISVLGGKDGVETPFTNGKANECYIEAIKYVKELYELGAFPKDAFTITSKERNNLFKTKKAAMITQGSWFIGELKEMEDSVDIIPFPWIAQEEAHPNALVYGFGCGTFYISRKAWDDAGKKPSAISLLRALTSVDTADELAIHTSMLSNVKIDEEKVGYSVLVKKGQEMIKNAGELIGPPDSFVDRGEWERVIVKNFPYVLAGRESAKTLWDNFMKKGSGNY